MNIVSFGLVTSFWTIFAVYGKSTKRSTCEVCSVMLQRVLDDMEKDDQTSQEKLDDKIKEKCGGAAGKEQRFCYYIGALPESATYIMNEVTKPLSWSMPPEKVCERLQEKDGQICELEYDKEIDWDSIDLNSLRAKELRKILDGWGEKCEGCTEKTEFVNRIQELKAKYVPAKTEL